MKDYEKLISYLFHSQIQTHIFHLQTKSFAEHKALNDYYSAIDGLTDGLVESAQGKYGIVKNYKTFKFEDYTSHESTIKYLEGLAGKVDELRKDVKDSYLQNQIDGVVELIESTLYKLKYLS